MRRTGIAWEALARKGTQEGRCLVFADVAQTLRVYREVVVFQLALDRKARRVVGERDTNDVDDSRTSVEILELDYRPCLPWIC